MRSELRRFFIEKETDDVIENKIEGGHQDERNSGRKKKPECEADDHWFQEKRLKALLQEQREDAGNGGNSG